MALSELQHQEIIRLQYLEAMGIDSYVPHQVLPGALPSVLCEWPGKQPFETVTTDKNPLKQLQHDRAALQQKTSTLSRPAALASRVEQPAHMRTPAVDVMQFHWAIFQPTREWLVLVPAQHTDSVHLQLLKNILQSVSIKTNDLVPFDNFVWPPRGVDSTKISRTLISAQETLHSLLEGYQLKYLTQDVLVFAGDLAERLFERKLDGVDLVKNINVLCLPELQQMLDDSDYKKITWQKNKNVKVVSFVIRLGCEKDLEELLKIECSAHSYPWAPQVFEDLFRSRYIRCDVIEDKDKNILGFSFIQSVADEASLLNIVISPSHQGKGLGRYLLNYLIDELLVGKSVQNFFLEVRVSNFLAIALYLSCGFVEIGERRDYYEAKGGSRENALMMALPIL